MARKFRLSWKVVLASAVMLVIGFLTGYSCEVWHQGKSTSVSTTNQGKSTSVSTTNNVYPEVPDRELEIWIDKKNESPAVQKHFESILKNTKVIVIRSWTKIADPALYRVISLRKEVEEIVQSTRIQYVRERQPMHVSYQLFFLSETGDYMMIYEKIPKGGSIIDLIPVTVKYDSYGRIVSLEDRRTDFQYIQAYPSPEFQYLIDKYVVE